MFCVVFFGGACTGAEGLSEASDTDHHHRRTRRWLGYYRAFDCTKAYRCVGPAGDRRQPARRQWHRRYGHRCQCHARWLHLVARDHRPGCGDAEFVFEATLRSDQWLRAGGARCVGAQCAGSSPCVAGAFREGLDHVCEGEFGQAEFRFVGGWCRRSSGR